ncbi:hypothetical protein D3C76_1683560 [compost metagenome]
MKIVLNQRTVENLDEVMRIISQTSRVHVVNLMVSAFLESLKAPVVKSGGSQ